MPTVLARPANISDEDYLFDAHPAHKSGMVAVRLRVLSLGVSRRTTDQIGYYFYDPYSHNLEAGSPTSLSRESVVALSNCHWETGCRNLCNRKRDQNYSATLPLCERDCLTLAREQQ